MPRNLPQRLPTPQDDGRAPKRTIEDVGADSVTPIVAPIVAPIVVSEDPEENIDPSGMKHSLTILDINNIESADELAQSLGNFPKLGKEFLTQGCKLLKSEADLETLVDDSYAKPNFNEINPNDSTLQIFFKFLPLSFFSQLLKIHKQYESLCAK